MSTHTSLKGFDHVGECLLSDVLEDNIISWFSWGLLGKGGFFNVTIPTSGHYGGQQHRLRPVHDPNYTDGQVWGGFRSDWVWETGVEYSHQPIRVSGVYVNSSFKPATGVGTYSHRVDYPRGQVIFDTAIPATSTVSCEYSHRLFNFAPASAPWWRRIQFNSFRVDSPQYLQAASGAWSVLAQNRVQLPAAVVEVVPNVRRNGYEIGNQVQSVRQQVLFHVLSETPYERGQLHDIITYQQEKTLFLFDKNSMINANAYPLVDGTPVESGKMYPTWVKPSGEGGYGWRRMVIEKVSSTPSDDTVTAPLYACTVSATVKVEIP